MKLNISQITLAKSIGAQTKVKLNIPQLTLALLAQSLRHESVT